MENIFDNISAILMLFLVVAGSSGGTWFTVETLKVLAAGIGKLLPGALRGTALSGKATWVVAALVAVGYVVGFDINLFGDFTVFEGLDAEFLRIVNAALLAIGANAWHDKVFDN